MSNGMAQWFSQSEVQSVEFKPDQRLIIAQFFYQLVPGTMKYEPDLHGFFHNQTTINVNKQN